MVSQARILLIEDNELLRAGLRHVLSNTPHCIIAAEAPDLVAAEELLRAVDIDIVLLKYPIANGNAIGFVTTMRELNPSLRILMLLEEDAEFWEALHTDADGYEVRHMPAYQLAAAIHSLRDGYAWIGPMLARYLLKRGGRQRVLSAAKKRPVNGQLIALLSVRETEVLELLSEGLNGDDIAKRLEISPKTVKLHISNCIRKLSVQDRTQAIAKFLRYSQS